MYCAVDLSTGMCGVCLVECGGGWFEGLAKLEPGATSKHGINKVRSWDGWRLVVAGTLKEVNQVQKLQVGLFKAKGSSKLFAGYNSP